MKTIIKTTVLALALMGGAAHAQSTTPGQDIDISVQVGAQCSIDMPAAITLSNTGEETLYDNQDFFNVVCNKDLPYSLAFSGTGVDTSDGNFNVTLSNENGVGYQIQGLIGGSSIVSDTSAIGTGQTQTKALKFYYYSDPVYTTDIGTYTATVTTTVVY